MTRHGPAHQSRAANVGGSLTCGQADFQGLAEGGYCVGQTSDVGSFAPNPWGLYDMHGNVREWCADGWDALTANYPSGAVSDPHVPSGPGRVNRGGDLTEPAWFCRSACRSCRDPALRSSECGFRVVLAPTLAP